MNKKYFKNNIIVLLAVVIIVIGYRFFTMPKPAETRIRFGSLNCTDVTYDKFTLTKLDGDWTITTKGLEYKHATFPYVLKSITNTSSYHLIITLPKKGQYYSLLMPPIYTNYALYVNGKLIYANGEYNNSDTIYPHYMIHNFYADSQQANIDLYVSNKEGIFNFRQSSILFGTPEGTVNRYMRNISIDLIFTLVMFISAIYNIILFIYDTKRKDFLTLSLLLLAVTARTIILNACILCFFQPNLTMDFVTKFDTILQPAIMILLLLYSKFKFGEKLPQIPYLVCQLIIIVYSVIIPFLPVNLYPLVQIYFILPSILAILLQLSCAFKTVKDKSLGAISYIASLFFVLFALLFDYFNQVLELNAPMLFPICFAIFVALERNVYIKDNSITYRREITLAASFSDTLDQLKKEESNFLSSHLKAHFLFNALNIISAYAITDPERSKNTTAALKIYLQQLFEHDNLTEMNDLKNEMELVKAFGYIEEQRFPGLNIIYDVPDVLPTLEVPCLLLQPLLENAINHGTRKRNSTGSGTVIVSVRPNRFFVTFSIKDDGAGTDEEVLRQYLNSNEDGTYHSLYHIQSRLKELYKENVIVRSMENVGTVISFRIPIE